MGKNYYKKQKNHNGYKKQKKCNRNKKLKQTNNNFFFILFTYFFWKY